MTNFISGFLIGALILFLLALRAALHLQLLPVADWPCTASHREGLDHRKHDVCDQYSRKNSQ